MVCKSCGAMIADDARFCTNCGATVAPAAPAQQPVQQQQPAQQPYVQQPYAQQPYAQQPPVQPVYVQQPYGYAQQPIMNTPTVNATPILVFGILGLAFACTMIFSILGIIFSAIAMSKGSTFRMATGTIYGKAKVGRILGKAGLITGIIMSVFFVIYVIVLVSLMAGL